MSRRAMISLASGVVGPDFWTKAMREEPPVYGVPRACADCPLRRGGELEEGARAALSESTPRQRRTWEAWGCHDGPRPCAGMRRLLKEVER